MTKQTILPPTRTSLSQLAKIEGNDRCVLTVYFPGSQARDKKIPGKLAELPATLIRPEGLTRDEAEHRRRRLLRQCGRKLVAARLQRCN